MPTLDPRSRPDARQALRIRRLLLGGLSYLFGVVGVAGLAAWVGLLPAGVWIRFAAMVLAIQAGLYLVFRSGANLRLRDPSLTAPQILLVMPPALYAMYHMDAGRSVLLFMLPIPILYGTLALSARALLAVTATYVAGYAAVVGLLAVARPGSVTLGLEALWLAALAAVGVQIALLGGYLSRLRGALAERNDELREAVDRIEELARHDELTGVWNRRHLIEALEVELARHARGGPPLALALLDLDRFKHVNDTLGHNAGDEVLRRTARVLRDRLRHGDVFGRWGGEELLAILPQTAPQGARASAERMRAAVEAIPMDDLEPGLRVTVSVGLAHARPDDSSESLVSRADGALYRAKRTGRNRVVDEADGAVAVAAGSG